METIRQTTNYPTGSIHLLDEQGDMLQRWFDLKGGNLSKEDLHKLQTTIAPNWMWHIVNAQADQPDGYFFSQYDRRCKLKPDLAGMHLADFPDEKYAANLREVYYRVKETGTSEYSKETILGSDPRSFFRIINPLIFSGRINQLLIATRYQDIPSSSYIVDEMGSTASQKIEKTLIGSQRPLKRAMARQLILQVNSFKSVSMRWNSGVNNFLESLTNNPIDSLSDGDCLSICG
ncbi:MAG: hypothetical protein COB93_06300 [Sneathiella sp.]|nr:MAG: hypothetical protein COB93_06300 [Sneathiella sp.]